MSCIRNYTGNKGYLRNKITLKPTISGRKMGKEMIALNKSPFYRVGNLIEIGENGKITCLIFTEDGLKRVFKRGRFIDKSSYTYKELPKNKEGKKNLLIFVNGEISEHPLSSEFFFNKFEKINKTNKDGEEVYRLKYSLDLFYKKDNWKVLLDEANKNDTDSIYAEHQRSIHNVAFLHDLSREIHKNEAPQYTELKFKIGDEIILFNTKDNGNTTAEIITINEDDMKNGIYILCNGETLFTRWHENLSKNLVLLH